MNHVSECCSNCSEELKSRRRDFSEQAWTVLVLWNEIQTAAVDQPICENCYNELREVLIDRAEEVEGALNEPVPTVKSVPAKRAVALTRQKVRKAG